MHEMAKNPRRIPEEILKIKGHVTIRQQEHQKRVQPQL